MLKQFLFGALFVFSGSQTAERPPQPAPPINFFSPQQDIEIGLDAASQAAHQVTFVTDPGLNLHLRLLGMRVTHNETLPKVSYQFRIVNSSNLSSAGFPNGAIFISKGLLELAANDDETAALIAHEVAHIACRHATVQLSRQLLVQAPISIAAGLTTEDGWKEQLAKLGVVFGIRASFLRYSYDQESEATLMAAQLLRDAHFDPRALSSILKKASNFNKAASAEFIYNHPQSADQTLRLNEEIEGFTPRPRPAQVTADFKAFHEALSKVPEPAAEKEDSSASDDLLPNLYSHPLEYYRFRFPEAWQVSHVGENGVIVAPPDGLQMLSNDIIRGAMFDIFDLSYSERPPSLEQATNRLIVLLRQGSQPVGHASFGNTLPRSSAEQSDQLRAVPGAQSPTLINDEPGLLTILLGKSAVTSNPEVVWVVTRMFHQNLFYMVCVAPEDEFPTYQPIFEQMIRSVELK